MLIAKTLGFLFVLNCENSNLISLLKKEPLTVDEVNQYGTGYINKNTEKRTSFFKERYSLRRYNYAWP